VFIQPIQLYKNLHLADNIGNEGEIFQMVLLEMTNIRNYTVTNLFLVNTLHLCNETTVNYAKVPHPAPVGVEGKGETAAA
jgi:hypothetical protein